MKIITYIRKCNPKQLAEFLSSSYYADLIFRVVMTNFEIMEQAKVMQNEIFHMELPPIISFDNTHWIDTKTRKLKSWEKGICNI